jgi:hypothetical protein
MGTEKGSTPSKEEEEGKLSYSQHLFTNSVVVSHQPISPLIIVHCTNI